MTFWLGAVSKARREVGDAWKGLPNDDKGFLEQVITGKSYAAELGRIVIASQAHFLFSTDEEWAICNVIPLFDMKADRKQAIQAWHGFVVWGTWDNRLLEHLLPKYVDAFPEPHSGFGKARDGFCSQLAGIAAFGKADPIESGWVIEFVRVVTEAERVRWAATFGQVLSGMEEASKDALWKRWLDRYWRDRVEGIPVQVSESEGGEMTEWSISLRIAFPEVVDRILRTPIPDLKGSFILTELNDSDLPQRHPEATASLVLHVLQHANSLPWDTREYTHW